MRRFCFILLFACLVSISFGVITDHKVAGVYMDSAGGTDEDGTFSYLYEDYVTSGALVSNQSALSADDILTYVSGNNWLGQSFSDLGMDPGYFITVGKTGCDYTDISTASSAASTSYTVFIYPGTYTVTSSIQIKSGVSYIGVGNGNVRIIGDIDETESQGSIFATIGSVEKVEFRNLYIENQHVFTETKQASRCLYFGSPSFLTDRLLIDNCYLVSGGKNALQINGGESGASSPTLATVQNCTIQSLYNNISILDNRTTIYVSGCGFKITSPSPDEHAAISVGDNNNHLIYISGCTFESTANTTSIFYGAGSWYINGIKRRGFGYFLREPPTAGYTFSLYGNPEYTTGETFSLTNTEDGDSLTTGNTIMLDTVFEEDVDITGNVAAGSATVTGNVDIGGILTLVDTPVVGGLNACRWNPATTPGSWQFSSDDGVNWDSNIEKRGWMGIGTDGSFQATMDVSTSDTLRSINGFEVGSNSVIDSNRYGTLEKLTVAASTAPTNGIGSQGDIATSDTLRSTNGLEVGSTSVIDASRVVTGTQINGDNLRLDGNTLSSTDANGNILFAPNGSGYTQVSNGSLYVGTGSAYVWGNTSGIGLRTAANDDIYFDAGGTFYFRDADNSYSNTVTIDSANGNIISIGTVSTASAIWQDFSAVSVASGNVAGFNVMDAAAAGTYKLEGWASNAYAPTYLESCKDTACCYFPIPYLAGSVFTRVRVKWQAQGNDDGVKLRIVKRDESGTATAWTVVGAQQTYTDAGAPYDVTVSTYDVADETMDASTAYAVEIEAEIAATGANLYSVGIETSKRIN